MFKINRLICGLALASPGLAFGQEPPAPVVRIAPAEAEAPADVVATEQPRASQVLGSTVHLQGTDNFGKVDDIILGTNGSPSYLVVANGDQHALMPWAAGQFNYGQRVVTYPVAVTAVKPLFFPRNAYPSLTDGQYVGRVRQVFPGGATTIRETGVTPGGQVVREKIRIKPNGDVKVRERIR